MSAPDKKRPDAHLTERRTVDAMNERAMYAAEPSESLCPTCGGDGWYVGHEDECYDTGDCQCTGVQIQCECQA